MMITEEQKFFLENLAIKFGLINRKSHLSRGRKYFQIYPKFAPLNEGTGGTHYEFLVEDNQLFLYLHLENRINNREKLRELLEIKQREFNTSIYLISDEPYKEIAYDGAKVPFILNYYKNSFIGYSYSKSLSLPGERIGYIAVNGNMDEFNDVVASLNVANRILGFVNAPSLFQRVIAKTLGAEVDVNIYKKNRDLLYNHLISLGFECVKPEGAFYLFPKALIEDDKKFAEAAKKYNILIVPGSAFGCPGYFRLSYCISYKKIEKSLESFTKLAKEFI